MKKQSQKKETGQLKRDKESNQDIQEAKFRLYGRMDKMTDRQINQRFVPRAFTSLNCDNTSDLTAMFDE